MEFHVVPYDRLTAQELRAWSAIQQAAADYASPYYRPEFAQAVHAVRGDVEVAVMAQGEHPMGFFAFQRRGHVGIPVGAPLADFQGPVVDAGAPWNVLELVRACGLAAWEFDHLPASLAALVPHTWRVMPSPYLDLSAGFEAYVDARRQTGTEKIKKTLQLTRKLAADIGPVRFVSHTDDPAAFEALIAWKTAQYHTTNVPDALAAAWRRALLQRIAGIRDAAFAGVLSGLYAGERLVAVHLGMQSGAVLHGWFPAYDPAFARYSPGSILWVELARAAPAMGVRRIDLGKGSEAYKAQFGSGATPVAEGRVDCRPVSRWLHHRWQQMRQRVGASALRAPAAAVLRMMSPWFVRAEA